jgi:pimeloyl-ACP methyl ester carboxylesterase
MARPYHAWARVDRLRELARQRLGCMGVRLLIAWCLCLVMPGVPVSVVMARAEATPAATPGDFSGLVDIGNVRRLYLECRGAGSPTVILEAGFRTRADVWTEDLVQPDAPRTMVLDGVASFTRVCAYDRPGTATVVDDQLQPSRSGPVPMPRTAAALVDDLQALLAAAGIPGPYVLVGHSYGGLVMRLYASTYPDEVVGLVQVDAFAETMQDEMTPEQWAAYRELFQPVPAALAGYPDLEFTDLDASLAEIREASVQTPLPTVPVVVLSRGLAMAMPDDLPGGLTGGFLEEAWTASQDHLAHLAPGVRQVIARQSEHYIQLQQPELVIAAVREVVDAVRDPSSWQEGTPVASPPSA